MAKSKSKTEKKPTEKEKSTETGTKAKKTPKNMSAALFKEKAFELIEKHAAGKGLDKLELLTKGFESPGKISFSGYNAKSFQPDALAHFGERTDVYSLEGESSKKAIARNLGKWILFSLEAKKSRGSYFIITTKACFKTIDEIIKSKQINVELITVD